MNQEVNKKGRRSEQGVKEGSGGGRKEVSGGGRVLPDQP